MKIFVHVGNVLFPCLSLLIIFMGADVKNPLVFTVIATLLIASLFCLVRIFVYKIVEKECKKYLGNHSDRCLNKTKED